MQADSQRTAIGTAVSAPCSSCPALTGTVCGATLPERIATTGHPWANSMAGLAAEPLFLAVVAREASEQRGLDRGGARGGF